MGLKDIGKIVANQTKLEKFNEANPVAPESPRQQRESDKKYAGIDTTPFTSKPADTTGHIGFKFDSKNPFHKDILNTLVNNGDDGDIVLSDRGVSIPKKLAYSEAYRSKFATAAETGGGEFRFEGEAAKPVARKADKSRVVASRPTPPKKPTASPAVQAVAARLNVDQERAAKRLDTPEAIAARNALLKKNRGK